MQDSIIGRDGTDSVHDAEILRFDDADVVVGAPILVLNAAGNQLLATFDADELDLAVNYANSHAGVNIIELKGISGPFSASTWPVTVTEAVTIRSTGGTATINAGANSGITIAESAVLGGGAIVRLEGLDITGNGVANDTVGVLFSGVYEGATDGAIEIINTAVSGFGQNGVAVIGGGAGLTVTIDGDSAAPGTQTSTITGSGGHSTGGGGSGDILFFAFTGAAALKNLVVMGTTGILAGSADNGIQFAGYDGTDKSVDHAIGAVTFQNVAVNGSYEKTLVYVQGYNNLSALGFSGGLALGNGASAATWTGLFIDGGPQGVSYIPSGTVDGAIDGNINLTGVTVVGGTYGTSLGFAPLGGKPVVVNGTLTDDLITGTLANEAFIGLTGNDTIITGGGDDVVLYNVGSGQDTVTDSAGADILALTNFGVGGAPSGTPATWSITAAGPTLSVDTDLPATTDEVAATGVEKVVVQLGDGGDTVVLDGNLAGASVTSVEVNGGAGGADGIDTLDARTLSAGTAIINTDLGLSNDIYRAADTTASDNVNAGGGAGDLLDYSVASAGVTIDLAIGTASGTSIGSDLVSNFENATGGTGDDSISGTAGVNALIGGAGDDTLTGRGDNDILTGGETGETHGDTAAYTGTITAGMIATNGAGGWTVTSGGEGIDTLSGIESVQGAESDRSGDRQVPAGRQWRLRHHRGGLRRGDRWRHHRAGGRHLHGRLHRRQGDLGRRRELQRGGHGLARGGDHPHRTLDHQCIERSGHHRRRRVPQRHAVGQRHQRYAPDHRDRRDGCPFAVLQHASGRQ